MCNINQLRKTLCRERTELPATRRQSAADRIVQRIRQLAIFRSAQHVALYYAVNGEVDLRALWQNESDARRWYLPTIQPGTTPAMQFFPHDQSATLAKNHYGLLEPDPTHAQARPTRELDIVLTPLVAFDASGHRIGMGAGYYDRTFSFLKDHPTPDKPTLIGIGYEFQRVQSINPQPWDVPLFGVITEQAVYGKLKEDAA